MTVHYMASMARCGETVLLRCLNAHSKIIAVGGGFRPINRAELPAMDAEDQIYVVKQIWEEPFDRGFILVRQPIAVYASLVEYQRLEQANGHPWTVTRKLQQWMRDIDSKLQLAGDDMDSFCTYYNRRFGALLMNGQWNSTPIERYEEFALNPALTLRRICEGLGLEYEPAMLESHKAYREGQNMHGRNIGSRPVDTGSLNKWRRLPSDARRRIAFATHYVASAYGYNLQELIDAR